jgi:hypothetical protein
MLRYKIIAVAMCIVVLTSGCSGILQGDENPTTDNDATNDSVNAREKPETPGSSNLSTGNKIKSSNTNQRLSYFSTIFWSTVTNTSITVGNISRKSSTLRVTYLGNFTNQSRTISELTYITAIFAGVVNKRAVLNH